MLWINAVVSGVHVSLVQLFLMRIRKVPPTTIFNCLIEDTHSTFNMDLMRGIAMIIILPFIAYNSILMLWLDFIDIYFA